MTRPEPLKPQAATLPEASPELDAAVPSATTLAADADADLGEAESTTAQAPRAARGRGEPTKTAAAPRTAKGSPSPKAALPDAPPAVTPSAEAWMTPPAPQPGTEEPTPHDVASEDEDFGHPPSRLSGLRNLLVSLGRRSLIEDESAADEADTEPRFERASARPAYHEPPTAETESIASAPAPVRVTAPPEFLPPKPAAEAEKEKEPLRPTPPVPRRERESPDEVQTLPSWRGQYRKKRYPPI